MTVFDALLLGVLFVSIFFASVRGATRELATLAVLVVAALIAWLASKPIAALFGVAESFFVIAGVAAALGTGVFFGGYLLKHKLMLRLKFDARMRKIDRIGGGAFGLVRALALIGLGFLGYGYYLDDANQPDAVRKALLLPVATRAAGFFQRFAPTNRDLNAEPQKGRNAAADGYDNTDRSRLKEMVTTVTTTEAAKAESADPIADILTGEEVDGDPQR